MCVCGMEYCIYEQWNLVFSRQLRVRNEMFSSKKKKEKKKRVQNNICSSSCMDNYRFSGLNPTPATAALQHNASGTK